MEGKHQEGSGVGNTYGKGIGRVRNNSSNTDN